jgi:hypothetical protein
MVLISTPHRDNQSSQSRVPFISKEEDAKAGMDLLALIGKLVKSRMGISQARDSRTISGIDGKAERIDRSYRPIDSPVRLW